MKKAILLAALFLSLIIISGTTFSYSTEEQNKNIFATEKEDLHFNENIISDKSGNSESEETKEPAKIKDEIMAAGIPNAIKISVDEENKAFEAELGHYYFDFNSETYSLFLREIENESALFYVVRGPELKNFEKVYVLSVGDEKIIDLDDDGIGDLRLQLNEISLSGYPKVKFSVKLDSGRTSEQDFSQALQILDENEVSLIEELMRKSSSNTHEN